MFHSFLDNSSPLNEYEGEELLEQIDFSCVNDETINVFKDYRLIAPRMINEGALPLAVKRRHELDESSKSSRHHGISSELTSIEFDQCIASDASIRMSNTFLLFASSTGFREELRLDDDSYDLQLLQI